MAFYVRLQKIADNSETAEYSFADAGREGILKINKSDGEVELIAPMPGDDNCNCFNRAAVTIMRRWRDGSLPEIAEWAS